jgi:hypothetical protein
MYYNTRDRGAGDHSHLPLRGDAPICPIRTRVLSLCSHRPWSLVNLLSPAETQSLAPARKLCYWPHTSASTAVSADHHVLPATSCSVGGLLKCRHVLQWAVRDISYARHCMYWLVLHVTRLPRSIALSPMKARASKYLCPVIFASRQGLLLDYCVNIDRRSLQNIL